MNPKLIKNALIERNPKIPATRSSNRLFIIKPHSTHGSAHFYWNLDTLLHDWIINQVHADRFEIWKFQIKQCMIYFKCCCVFTSYYINSHLNTMKVKREIFTLTAIRSECSLHRISVTILICFLLDRCSFLDFILIAK